MRRLPILLLLLTTCDLGDPPPGEVIGTFSFTATLRPDHACPFDAIPEALSFAGTLSHDPEGGKAWMQIGRSLREGSIDRARFAAGMPFEEGGERKRVPRQFRNCTCEFLFEETIEGVLVRSAVAGCENVVPDEGEPTATSCPRVDEEGKLAWDTCGSICGTLREEATRDAGASCTCTVEGAEVDAPAVCELVYDLVGHRMEADL